MGNLPAKPVEQVELDDCLWLEDHTQAGLEPGQYKVAVRDLGQAGGSELAILYGNVSSPTLGSKNVVINYTDAGNTAHFDGTPPNKSTGVITIPDEGLYRVSGRLMGTQLDDTKEEDILLYLRQKSSDFPIALKHVATDKSTLRLLQGYQPLFCDVGDTLSLVVEASTGMGSLTNAEALLEVEFALRSDDAF